MRAVVHRHDPARAERARDLVGQRGADRRAVADRDEQQVDLAERRGLLAAQDRLAEVAEVRDAHAVELERVHHVGAALRARDGVVLGGDADDGRRPACPRTCPRSSGSGAGSPPTTSTALWSGCSWVTSSRSAVTPSSGG